MKCKIILKDEVNCKVEGLSLTTRRNLEKKLKFFLPYAFHVPAYKLGRWDGCVSFFTMGGSTFINALPFILPVLEEDRYEIDIEDNRASYDLQFDKIVEEHFANRVWPKGHPAEGEPVILRDYQVDIINKFLENPQSVQEIATGAGKTLMTAALSNLVEPYGRSIVIVPNKDLVVQTEADYINLGLDVGVYFGDRKDFGKTHTICTWQSLNIIEKRFRDGEQDWELDDFAEGVVCIMVDECFDGDTLVTTPRGKIPIKDLKAGDRVINLCEKTKQYKEDTVVKVHKNLTHSASEKMLELEFDNNVIIKVTANHKFLTNKGWVRADELTEDLEIIDINTYS
jgi:hypothetical protein